MNLATGAMLGPYELLSPLGKGGMGEVYRARDTRLDRTVAVKVLPPHLSSSPERRQRFEREARAVSSLSHPHICALYDVGRQDGIDYLVMEYIEGESLADRLSKGPLPLDQALRYSIQLANALDKAHRSGIVHRDLKPANIMLTKSGAKLLDFGLAKLRGNSSEAAPSLTSLPTERVSITAEGTILGTFQYMAPEQLEGREADARTDIFAFGAVVYEMATGKRAFNGKSQASLITAIMSADPQPISELQPMSPPALDRIVKRCLAKDPDERWQTAHDLMEELKWVAEAGSQAGAAAPVAARRKIGERGWMIATVVLSLVAVLLAVAYFGRAPVEMPAAATRFLIHPPEKTSFGGTFAVSPDGRRVVLPGTSEGKTQLWVHALDSLSAQPLAGTEEATAPFWSPDSRFIGFFSSGKLKKIEAAGGPVQTLCDALVGSRGACSPDNVIIFAHNSDALYRVSAAGGAPAPVTALDASRKETAHVCPKFLPDGRHFIYLAASAQRENSGIYVGSLDSKETKLLVNAYQGAAYAPPGYLLFMRERTLMAQGFDANRLELRGEPFPVAEQVELQSSAEPRFAFFSVSETGVLVYRSGTSRNSQLTWFDRSGKQLGTVGPPGAYGNPSLSPDEKRVAVQRGELPGQGGSPDIWLIETGPRGATERFTFDPATETNPLWSPDGSRIVFSSNRDGPLNLYQKAVGGAGGDGALFKSDNIKVPFDWSRDGRFLLYAEADPKMRQDIWVLPLSEGQKPFPFLQTEFIETHAQFSPDGKWIAYSSNESGTWQVYVRSFPDRGGKWPVSTSGGVQPRWRRDGRELFYISADKKLMAVDVKSDGATFEAGVPKALFDVRVLGVLPGPMLWYTVSKDGQRFLVVTNLEEATAPPTTVVLNWTADLKR